MKKCKTCENAVFDEKWGEYKCLPNNHRVYDDKVCTDYKPRKKKQEGEQTE